MLLMAPDLTGWPQPTQGATERILDTIQLKVYASSDLRYHVESAIPGWTAHSTAAQVQYTKTCHVGDYITQKRGCAAALRSTSIMYHSFHLDSS
jgi:hypothetical protein